MKKKYLKGLVVFLILGLAAINMNFNTTNDKMSTINFSNVEALASGEGSDCDVYCKSNGNGCYCSVWWPTFYEQLL